MLPALWNGFPLLEYDTGGYLARWFEGYLVPSRSTTYGLFLTAGWPLDFWPIVILQAAAAVWIVGLVLRLYRFNSYPAGLVAIVVALALTTSLPWLASELLTDIFAGLAVLALDALGAGAATGSHPLSASHWWHLLAFAVSTHSATYAVVLALSSAGARHLAGRTANACRGAAVARAGHRPAAGRRDAASARNYVVGEAASPGRQAATALTFCAHAGGRNRHPLSQRSLSRSAAEALSLPQRAAARCRRFPVGRRRIRQARPLRRAGR